MLKRLPAMRYFHLSFIGHLSLCIWAFTSALGNLATNHFVLSFFCFGAVLWQAGEAYRNYCDDRLRQYFRKINKKLDQIRALVDEINVPPTSEEVYAVINGTLTLEDLRKTLLERKAENDNTIKTDCMYYSNSFFLKCAVNPATPCNRCAHHFPVEPKC